MTTRIEVIRASETPADLAGHINRNYRVVFPDIDENSVSVDGIEYAPSEWRVLIWHEGVWSGVVGILPRAISVGGETVNVGGIGGVTTIPEKRGLGLGKVMLRRAMEVMCDDLKLDAGMLFCSPKNMPYYTSVGWERMQRRMVYRQSDGEHMLADHEIYMVQPCAGFAFPDGDIDVRGRLW